MIVRNICITVITCFNVANIVNKDMEPYLGTVIINPFINDIVNKTAVVMYIYGNCTGYHVPVVYC